MAGRGGKEDLAKGGRGRGRPADDVGHGGAGPPLADGDLENPPQHVRGGHGGRGGGRGGLEAGGVRGRGRGGRPVDNDGHGGAGLHPLARIAVPLSNEDCRQLWSNIDTVIEGLNNYAENNILQDNRFTLRKEYHSPHIYWVVVNAKIVDDQDEWKMCKVGLTGCDTVPGDNRMEFIQEKANIWLTTEKICGSASILFVLRADMSNGSTPKEVEEDARNATGIKIHKKLIKDLGFSPQACPTEWVLTTQAYITKMKKDIMKRKGKGESITARIFKENAFKWPPHPSVKAFPKMIRGKSVMRNKDGEIRGLTEDELKPKTE